jgi:predicted transposase/invertase (TIGR01784 family)
MTVIKNPHDKYFKSCMRNLRIAKEFFLLYLPPYISNIINLDSLRLEKTTFINNKLGQSLVDMLYNVKFNDDYTGYLYVLAEHQSTPDKHMAFRLLHYMLEIMKDHIDNEKQGSLPIVVPLVFYNGQQRWIYSTDFFTLFGKHEKLARSIFFQPFNLIDVGEISDEQLNKLLYSGVMQFTQKHIYDPEFAPRLEEMLPKLQNLQSKQYINYVDTTLRYVMDVANIAKPDKMINLISNKLSKSIGDKLMTTCVEYWKKEGLEIGHAEGKAEGKANAQKTIAINMLREGAQVNFIAKVTGLNIKEIQSLEVV